MKIKIIYEDDVITSIINKHIQVKDLIKQLKKSQYIKSNQNEFLLLADDQKVLDENEYINSSKITENIINENTNKEHIINENTNTENISNLQRDIKKGDANPEKVFYLLNYKKDKNKKYTDAEDFKSNSSKKNLEIEDLIMKTTNAKTKLVPIKIKHERTTTERQNLIDELINSSLGNILGEGNVSNRGEVQQNFSQFFNILRPIIDNDMSEGEVVITSNRGPASIIINRSSHHRASVMPNENLVNNLKEMGFPEEQCRRALRMTRNDISRATDILLSGDMDFLPDENLNLNIEGNNNTNIDGQISPNINNNNNQNNEANVISNQDDEYMQNDFIESELNGDEDMSDIRENPSNSNIQNLPNIEVYINNFLNNNSQSLNNQNSNNNNNNNVNQDLENNSNETATNNEQNKDNKTLNRNNDNNNAQ